MERPIPTRFETARLRLREPVPADAEALFARYTQDPAISRFLVWQPHRTIDDTRAFIESSRAAWRAGNRMPFVVAERGDDSAIGMVEARFLGTTVDVGYVLARSHWGRGLIPEAIDALATACLASPSIFRVHAACDVENMRYPPNFRIDPSK
ncbi:MAG: GNAT family N-acetyltransferase [Lautropia sp.]